jgi:hypothetical protein
VSEYESLMVLRIARNPLQYITPRSGGAPLRVRVLLLLAGGREG